MNPEFVHGDSMRVVLVVAGIFALISFGILGYEVLPAILSHGIEGSASGSFPTLEQREQVVNSLGSNDQSAPVAPDIVAQRQKLLATLNPNQTTKSATSSKSTAAASNPQQPPSPEQQKAAEETTSAKLNVLQSLDTK